MDSLKKGHHKHSKIVILTIVILCVILGLLELSTFYTGVLNNWINLVLTIILFVLCIDNYLHFAHHNKNRAAYLSLSIIFLILTISHVIRQVKGPVLCSLPIFLSVYAYEGIAIMFGMFMIFSVIFLIRDHKKLNYHLISIGLTGIIILVNHIVKIFIGICV